MLCSVRIEIGRSRIRQCGALEDVMRRLIVDNRPSSSILTSNCNKFLFASICEERNGMQLSVLSALARMNVDPWEEAARLAAMPKAIAEKTLVSTIDQVSGWNWTPSEAEATAARLVQLLPRRSSDAQSVPPDTAISGVVHPTFWLVWLGLAIALSLLSPRHQATTTDAGVPASKSSVASPFKSGDPSWPKTN